jgi:phosphate transport system ATP-binding protein
MMASLPLPVVQALSDPDIILSAQLQAFYYDQFLALRNVFFPIYKNSITSLIGPSGCGKSTVLRCFNRLNDMIKGARLEGQVLFHNRNIYHPKEDPIELRRQIGMVFQQPNPFDKSIYNNVAFGPRLWKHTGDIEHIVERSLRQAGLWHEVKDRLKDNALALSGGQQQRLCIARTIAVQPEVILMDEPCAALDPQSTHQVEELIKELKAQCAIVIVTHNMQQASRISDMTAFFNVEMNDQGKTGELVEYNQTPIIFQAPIQELTRQYVTGRFG